MVSIRGKDKLSPGIPVDDILLRANLVTLIHQVASIQGREDPAILPDNTRVRVRAILEVITREVTTLAEEATLAVNIQAPTLAVTLQRPRSPEDF